LFLLLYADATVIIAESISDLQSALNAMYVNCDNWKLEVNASKTKVVIFSKGKCKILPTFYFNGTKLDIVEDFSYLGIKFNYNGIFNYVTQYACSGTKCTRINKPARRDVGLELRQKAESTEGKLRHDLTVSSTVSQFMRWSGRSIMVLL